MSLFNLQCRIDILNRNICVKKRKLEEAEARVAKKVRIVARRV